MYKVLTLNDHKEWENYLKKLPIEQQDIYYTPEYYALYENYGDGKAQCFVFEKDGEIALYPFLINTINNLGYTLDKEYFDIQGAYGYNGLISNNNSPDFLNSFFNNFDDYCIQNNVIVEFLRINPLLTNCFKNRNNFETIYNQDNIFLDLFKNNIFDTEYEYSTRKNVRKAIKNGLTFRNETGKSIGKDDLEAFCKIYQHTMSRNNAEEYYFFSNDFFNNLNVSLLDNALYSFVSFEKKIISCELVLKGKKIAYSFLGGTLSDYYQYRPNDFLKHNTINLLKEIGIEKFLLGGGPEGVFKYKKSFSKNGIIPFFIGKKIHNEDIYTKIIEQWFDKYPEKTEKYKNIILKYRY